MAGMAVVFPELKNLPCEECGMDAVHHGIERASLTFDFFSARIFRPLGFLGHLVVPPAERLLNWAGPHLLAILARFGLVQKITELDPHSTETALALWSEAEKRGIEIYEVRPLGLRRNLFVSRYAGRHFVFQSVPHPPRWQKALLWMDDKAEMKKRFRRAGFPVPAGGLAMTENQALKLFLRLRPPVVVKPYEGSGGRHTTTRIDSAEKLLAAFRNARQVAPFAVVEEELQGPVYRATLINRKLAGILRRDPPRVVGDGISTIRELVQSENRNPLRRGPVFAEINLDSAASREALTRQNLTLESVPARGQTVDFHFKVNWGVGGTSRDATPEAHPDNLKLFEDIGAYLQEDVVGIDFIIPDISRSWREEPRAGVIELNSLPHLGNHHFPYTGPVKNVAAAVWEMIYSQK